MLKTFKRFYFSLLLGGVLLTQTGCLALAVGAAAGAGGVIWAKGALHQELSRPVTVAYKATKRALTDMDLPVLNDREDTLTAMIESEFADGKKIKIDLDYVSKTTSKISIRVGTLGEEMRSREILQEILKHL